MGGRALNLSSSSDDDDDDDRPKCRICDKDATKRLKATAEATTCNEHFQVCYDAFKNSIENVRARYQKERIPDEIRPPPPPPPPEPSPTPTPTPTTTEDFAYQYVDKYGIKKLYPDAPTPSYRAMDMDNPTKDAFLNKEEKANMKKESADGSWSLDGKDTGKYQVRLGIWMNPPLTDVEGTIYAYHIEDIPGMEGESRYSYQFYRGGGDHSTSNGGCEGAAYKGRILENKDVVICKEIRHADYTSSIGNIKKLSKSPKGNWIGNKIVTYNLPKASNGRIPVKIEAWCDEEGMDQNGVLHPEKQNWVKMAEVTDKGGWSSGDGGGCPALEIGNTTGKRKPDEIFNMPGGKPDKGNVLTYRTDGAKTKIKYFSVRSIKNPATTTTTTTTTATATRGA